MVNQIQGAVRAPVSGGQGWVERVRSRAFRGSHPATQLGRFLVVGLGNTILSFIVYRLLLVAGAWYLLAADTIDETMAALIQRKREIVSAVTDGRQLESDGLVDGVIRELRNNRPLRHLRAISPASR